MPTVTRKSGEYVYYDDGSVALQTHTDNAPDSNSMNPVDIQSRYAQTIQTHNAVNVGASGNSIGSWIDCDGFSEIGITLLNDAGTSSSLDIQWSNDGSALHGVEQPLAANNSKERAGNSSVKARFARFKVINGDAAAHTMSAWVYLKA